MECKKLLILGAGLYGAVAFEIASNMGCFDNISFVDDNRALSVNGKPVVGTTQQLHSLSMEFDCAIVAIGNAKGRIYLLDKLLNDSSFNVVSLVSPGAFVSSSAQIEPGCIIEPMAVIHAGCKLLKGCIISAGAVVNHFSTCCEGVHVDCNATVSGCCTVPCGTKVRSGTVFS